MFIAGTIRKMYGVALLLLLSLLLLSPRSFAQQSKGLIRTGTVIDTSGAAVAGAGLKLAPLGITVVSDAQGTFRLPEVLPGSYTLTDSYVGFSSQTTDVVVAAGQTVNLSLTLRTASASEEIIVTAERPHGEAEAINETRTADNLLQVLPER